MEGRVLNQVYLIGSLRNPRIAKLGNAIRNAVLSVNVFDDWLAAGPEADDHWKEYEQARGRTYEEALEGAAAKNVFAFDKRNLDASSHAILVLPAGKSGHMEIMYAQYGVGAKTAILLDAEDVRWDVMYQFIPTILRSDEEAIDWLARDVEQKEFDWGRGPLETITDGKRNSSWGVSVPTHNIRGREGIFWC